MFERINYKLLEILETLIGLKMYYLHAIKTGSKVIISRGKNKKETIN